MKKMTKSELNAFRRGLAIGNKPKKRKVNTNPFAGADDIYLSKKGNIAIKKVSGNSERVTYVPSTDRNLNLIESTFGVNALKKLHKQRSIKK